jgi:hypothetical protein
MMMMMVMMIITSRKKLPFSITSSNFNSNNPNLNLTPVNEQQDPLAACRAVVNAAYDLWLRFDVRTDDITIIILQMTG